MMDSLTSLRTTLFTYSFSNRIIDHVKRRITVTRVLLISIFMRVEEAEMVKVPSSVAAIRVSKLALMPMSGGSGLSKRNYKVKRM